VADQDTFCAICERALEKGDSEHVCRSCFRKAREPKETSVYLTDEGAERLGFAYVLGNFVTWGVQKLVEYAGTKLPPPPKNLEEAARREADARERLKEIRRRLDGENWTRRSVES
jgi:hypothetical protein